MRRLLGVRGDRRSRDESGPRRPPPQALGAVGPRLRQDGQRLRGRHGKRRLRTREQVEGGPNPDRARLPPIRKPGTVFSCVKSDQLPYFEYNARVIFEKKNLFFEETFGARDTRENTVNSLDFSLSFFCI